MLYSGMTTTEDIEKAVEQLTPRELARFRVWFEAFDAACAELQDNNLSELVREIIAERIVEAARRGERDPQRLCSFAVAAMNGERNRINAPRWGR